jgi:hypothetical protein
MLVSTAADLQHALSNCICSYAYRLSSLSFLQCAYLTDSTLYLMEDCLPNLQCLKLFGISLLTGDDSDAERGGMEYLLTPALSCSICIWLDAPS